MSPRPDFSRSRNYLLATLSDSDFGLVLPHLKDVSFAIHDRLEIPNKAIAHVFFPEHGVVSVVAVGAHGNSIEAGIIGREGMTGIAVVMGNDRSPHSTFVQIAGNGQRIPAKHLRGAMAQSATLQIFLLQNAQAFMAQTAGTALANGRGLIEERLARWLLMAHDRMDGGVLPLTHEFLSLMLGVRRAGVTLAVQVLEGAALIRATRGVIVVLDRDGLEELSNGLYGVPEEEYRRLTGWQAEHEEDGAPKPS